MALILRKGNLMAPLESAQMVRARKLIIEGGLTPYAAAIKVGITRAAIYNAPWYKEWKESQK